MAAAAGTAAAAAAEEPFQFSTLTGSSTSRPRPSPSSELVLRCPSCPVDRHTSCTPLFSHRRNLARTSLAFIDRWYYLALFVPLSKTVCFSDIVRVDGEPELTVGPKTKLWGMNTAAPVWWACGEATNWLGARDSSTTITLKVHGETVQKGFMSGVRTP